MSLLLALGAAAVLGVVLSRPATRDASYASRAGLGPLRRRRGQAGGLDLGVLASSRWRRTRTALRAPPDSSLLILGPTQSGKTSSLVIPALLRWDGPVLAASVKDDLVRATAAWRRRAGPVAVLDPRARSGATVRFDPVSGASSLEEAQRAAMSLCEAAADELAGADASFWAQLAAKLLAPLLLAAHHAGGSLAEVASWVNRSELDVPAHLLAEAGEAVALEWLDAASARDPRTASSVVATAEAVLSPLLGSAGALPALDLDGLLRRDGTLYLCASAHDQRRHRPLFSAVVDELLERAFSLARDQGGRLERPLLVVLDEAAAIAPLKELDVLAATCASHGITLVTCFQDLAQLRARYGERSATVVNNHTTRALLSGLADPGAAELLGSLVGTARSAPRGVRSQRAAEPPERRSLLEPHELRRMPAHTAVLISGRLDPVRLALVPWWRQVDVRSRGPVPPARYASVRGRTRTPRR